jgi:hypothetical protein
MKTLGSESVLHAFLTLIIDGGDWWASPPGEEEPPSNLWIGGWVGPRAGLDAVASRKIPIIAPAKNRTPVIQPVA